MRRFENDPFESTFFKSVEIESVDVSAHSQGLPIQISILGGLHSTTRPRPCASPCSRLEQTGYQ